MTVQAAPSQAESGAGDAGQLEDRRLPTSTLDGWRRFVHADPSTIELLHANRCSELSEAQRRDYDEARIAHHAELVVVTTRPSPRSPRRAGCSP